jgi:hypothetical protein
VRFFIGDVRDKEHLARALDGIDYVVHVAAKILPTAEYNPFECLNTNVFGTTKLTSGKLFLTGNSYTGNATPALPLCAMETPWFLAAR